MKKILADLLILLFIGVAVKGQVVLYSTDFGSGTSLPAGWVVTGAQSTNIENSTASASSGYLFPISSSGGSNLNDGAAGTIAGTATITVTGQVNTVGYSSIQVLYAARKTATYIGNIVFEWSSDGLTWNNIAYTDVAGNTTWSIINGGAWLTLPIGAENQPNLQFRFIITRTSSLPSNYRIDDFTVQGFSPTGTQPSHYFRSRQSGNWNVSSSWESSADNVVWVSSTLVPTSSANTITIRNSHAINIVSSISADQLVIASGGVLNHASSAVFTLNDGVGVDMMINGTYVINGAIPSGDGRYEVESGGVIRVDANTGGNADNLAFSSNGRVLFKTGGVFQWNTNVIFETSGTSYFVFDPTETERPIFRISANNMNVGSNGTTTINGLLDVTGSVLWTGTGQKIFRDGITGIGNITQTEAGVFRITGLSAVLGITNPLSSITLSLGGGLELSLGSQVELIANTRIDGAVFTNNGIFNCQQFIVSGSTSFVNATNATLGIGSANGITTGAAGNIQTTGGRAFNSNATYTYNGTTNQVTGNGLPATVQVLSVSSFGGVGNNTITLTNTNTTVDRFNLNTGFFVAGTNGNLNIASGGAVFGTGGHQPNDPIAGTITFLGNGKTEGSSTGYPNLYAVVVNGGVNFNGDLFTGSATILNRLQINSAAFVQSNAPFYAPGSTLVYNTNGVYDRGIEWGNSSGVEGFPHHVVVQGNTILHLFTNPVTPAQLEIGGNLTIGNANGRGEVYMNNNMNKPLSVLGDIIIGSSGAVSSVLQLSTGIGGDLWLSGNLIRHNNSFFNPVSRAVFFRGGTTTSISTPGVSTPGVSSQDFNYMRLEKTGGASVVLNCAIGIINELTFTSGFIASSNSNLLIFYDNATAVGANALSFANGPVRKTGNDAFVFPVGKPQLAGPAGGGYRFVGISAPSQVTDAFTAEFIVASATALGPLGAAAVSAGLTRVSRCEYWRLDRNIGSSSVNVTLSWNARSNCNVSYVSDLPTLAIAHFNGTNWDSFGANTTTGNITEGSITWNNVSNFSPFSLASTDFHENVLPLDLSVFKVRARKTDVAIDWMLNSNDEQEEYIVERSKNGFQFEPLKVVQAKVILNTAAYAEEDKSPFIGWNYYRLRAVDKLGRVRSSQIEKVWFSRTELIHISPNPASEKILISFAEPGSISQIELINISGLVLQRLQTITFNTEINIAHLHAGMYLLRITGKNGTVTKSFIKQ